MRKRKAAKQQLSARVKNVILVPEARFGAYSKCPRIMSIVNLCDSSSDDEKVSRKRNKAPAAQRRALGKADPGAYGSDDSDVSIIEPASVLTKPGKRPAASSSSSSSLLSSSSARALDRDKGSGSAAGPEVACAACSFLNRPGLLQCTMCLSELQITNSGVSSSSSSSGCNNAADATAAGEDLLAMLLEGYDVSPASSFEASSAPASSTSRSDMDAISRKKTKLRPSTQPASSSFSSSSSSAAAASASASASAAAAAAKAAVVATGSQPAMSQEKLVPARAAKVPKVKPAAASASAGSGAGAGIAEIPDKAVLLSMDCRCPAHIIQAMRVSLAELKSGPLPLVEELAALEGLCVWLKPVEAPVLPPHDEASLAGSGRSSSGSNENSDAQEGLRMQLLPHAAIMSPTLELLQLMMSDTTATTFPHLFNYVLQVRSVLGAQGMPPNARVILVLNGVKRAIESLLRAQLGGKDGAWDRMAVSNGIVQAQAWLLVEHRVETVLFEHVEEVTQYLSSTSVYLAKALLSKPLSDLEDVASISLKKQKEQAAKAGDPSIVHRAVWENMLMNINGMSAARAKHAVTHVDARCPSRAYELLRQEQQDRGIAAARERLRYVFSAHEEKVLSGKLYDALLCADPSALVSNAEDPEMGISQASQPSQSQSYA